MSQAETLISNMTNVFFDLCPEAVEIGHADQMDK